MDGLDPGIARAVEVLVAAGVETFESCEGGNGHSFPEPTVRFFGSMPDAYVALAAAIRAQLVVVALKRVWTILDAEITTPVWELTFRPAPGREWWPGASGRGEQEATPGSPRPLAAS